MPLLSLRRHWRKSLLLFLVVTGIGLPVAWIKGTARYYAEAVVHINFRFAPNLQAQQEVEMQSINQYERLVQHQLRTINRFDVVQRALASLGEERWRWQGPAESEGQAVRRLMGALQVNAVRDTFLITVGLADKDPTLIPLLVNPIVENYLEVERQETFYGADTRLANLDRRRDALMASIAALADDLRAKARTLGIATFDERLQNPYDQILADANAALARARRERLAAEAELAALTTKHATLMRIPLDSEAEKLVSNDRALGDLRTYLYQRRAQLVQTISGLKPSHSGRQAAEREIEQINREVASATEIRNAELKAILEERRHADIATEEAEHRARLDQTRKVEDTLAIEVVLRKRDVDEFVQVYTQALAAKDEMERQQRTLRLINDRIDAIRIEEDAPGSARLVSLAQVPELPTSGGRKKLFILFLVAGTGMALALPLALDFLDGTIRTPIDLHRVLGFAPSTWLPAVASDQGASDRLRILFDEQLGRLANAVLRDLRAREGGASFLVTEALPGSGKTLVVSALADRMQRLGVATLAVSCDATAPFALGMDEPGPGERSATAPGDAGASGPGLLDLLRREATLDGVLIPGGTGRADRIRLGAQAGDRSSDGADAGWQILDAIRLREVVAELTARYGLVLIDGPAILPSALAETIAGICYGTLLVVAAQDTPVKRLKRAAAILERAAPEVVGSVLNRTPLFAGGGYFDRLADDLVRYRGLQGRAEIEEA